MTEMKKAGLSRAEKELLREVRHVGLAELQSSWRGTRTHLLALRTRTDDIGRTAALGAEIEMARIALWSALAPAKDAAEVAARRELLAHYDRLAPSAHVGHLVRMLDAALAEDVRRLGPDGGKAPRPGPTPEAPVGRRRTQTRRSDRRLRRRR